MRSVVNRNVTQRVPMRTVYMKVVDYRYKWTQNLIRTNGMHLPKVGYEHTVTGRSNVG